MTVFLLQQMLFQRQALLSAISRKGTQVVNSKCVTFKFQLLRKIFTDVYIHTQFKMRVSLNGNAIFHVAWAQVKVLQFQSLVLRYYLLLQFLQLLSEFVNDLQSSRLSKVLFHILTHRDLKEREETERCYSESPLLLYYTSMLHGKKCLSDVSSSANRGLSGLLESYRQVLSRLEPNSTLYNYK